MNNFLLLEFRNAKLFSNRGEKIPYKRSKDKIFFLDNRLDRDVFYHEAITVHQVSNMIHVLFGERPVPSIRKVFHERVDIYFQKAMDSYLKIYNHKVLNNLSGIEEYPAEIMQTKKAVDNAWSNISHVSWARLRRLLKDKIYHDFLELIEKTFNINPLSKTFEEVKKMIKNCDRSAFEDFFKMLKKTGNTSLVTYIIDDITHINQAKNKTAITVVNGIEKVNTLNGSILVPVTDKDIEILKQNKGCATILDGGLVYIKGIKSGYEIDGEGYIKVSEIDNTLKHYKDEI